MATSPILICYCLYFKQTLCQDRPPRPTSPRWASLNYLDLLVPKLAVLNISVKRLSVQSWALLPAPTDGLYSSGTLHPTPGLSIQDWTGRPEPQHLGLLTHLGEAKGEDSCGDCQTVQGVLTFHSSGILSPSQTVSLCSNVYNHFLFLSWNICSNVYKECCNPTFFKFLTLN